MRRPVRHSESRQAVAAKERKIRRQLARSHQTAQLANVRPDVTAKEPIAENPAEQPPVQAPLPVAEVDSGPSAQPDGVAAPINTGAYKIRIDAAQSQIQGQAQGGTELEELLERAITLLETVTQHPALRDFSDYQRRLDEIEQRLSQGSYPQ